MNSQLPDGTDIIAVESGILEGSVQDDQREFSPLYLPGCQHAAVE